MPAIMTYAEAVEARDNGYSQIMRVGDWGYHPMANRGWGLVRCVKSNGKVSEHLLEEGMAVIRATRD